MVFERHFPYRWILLIVLLACACIVAGCSSSSEPPSSTSAQPTTSGHQAAVTTGTSASRPAAGSVEAVDFNLLLPLLPNPPAGWTAEAPNGMKMTHEDGSYTFASRTYKSGDKSATVMIYDSAYYGIGGWDLWQAKYEWSSTAGYWKTDTVAGFPAWESYTKEGSSYSKWIGLNERFAVMVMVEDAEKADLDAFVNAVNYKSIAALK
jgi:hypothetical protein